MHEIFVQGTYSFDQSSPAPYIIDCGANIGFSVLFFKALHPNAKILAFEPEPSTFEALQQNVTGNGYDDVELRQAAVADKDGHVTLYTPDSDDGSILASTRQEWSAGRASDVLAVRLASVIQQRVDLLKLDIEGAEYSVIHDLVSSGAIQNVRQIILEFHALPSEPEGSGRLERLLVSAGMDVVIEEHGSPNSGIIRAQHRRDLLPK